MALVVIESEDLEKMIDKAVSRAIEIYAVQVPISLPPVLTKTGMMQLLDIKANKAQELFNRPDFPVNREFGHPRIPTGLLLKWIDANTNWVNDNAGNGYNAR